MNRYFSKSKWAALFSVLPRPLKIFYEIRYRGLGSVPLAILTILCFGATYAINRAGASIVVSDIDPRWVNLPRESMGVLSLFVLFSVANWSVTCLMDGEGRFADILTVVGYALLPLIITWLPSTALSWFIAANEQAFYYLFIWAGAIWSGFLIITGLMTVHAFSLGKTFLSLLLTAVSICIIIFVALMLVNLLNQLLTFIRSVYTEIIFML